MSDPKNISRREFLQQAGKVSAATYVAGQLLDSSVFTPKAHAARISAQVFLARNGTPAQNVAKVIQMRFGGIEHFIGREDVVVINPNGQWPRQGGSNCACCMGLIDLILQRPGGFDGEILFVECVQFQSDSGSYWGTSDIVRNGPYNFNNMLAYYHNAGHTNVNGFRLLRNEDDPEQWPVIAGPQGGQGWVRPEWQSPTSGSLFYLPYPVLRSPYSNRLIDLKHGVYAQGSYAGQPALRFIKMPNFNNHGDSGQQDYAGITGAVKSFLGITELEGDYRVRRFKDGIHYNLHAYQETAHGATEAQRAFAAGEAIGGWMRCCRKPDVVLTTAEWVGWQSRTGEAAWARTVGLADDPATLDYYMVKHVFAPLCPPGATPYFDPDHHLAGNNTRQTINGCVSMGYGTADASRIAAYVFDHDAPRVFRFEIDRKIDQLRREQATAVEVQGLIEQYNQQ